MSAVISSIVVLISAALLPGIGADVAVLNVAQNTTVKLTCIAPYGALFPPTWVMNGSTVLSDGGYRSSRDGTGLVIGELIINNIHTCGEFSVYCRLHNGQIVHNTTLTVEGPLPSPENVHMNESNNILVIEWDPPYTAINRNETSIMRMDPHITQYTVYIVDNYTGNCIDKVNVTETSFTTNTTDDNSCPMYGVTAWNSGGEGDMSPLLLGYLPRIPRSIAAEDVSIHREIGALDIQIKMTDLSICAIIPNFFRVDVVISAMDIKRVEHHHQSGHPVATIHVTLPSNVDECNLIIRISAWSSAGTSSPTEITVRCQTTGYSTDIITTTGIGSATTSTDNAGQNHPGYNNTSIIYIAIGISVGAVMIVGAITVVVVLWICRRNTNAGKDETVMQHNQAYETVTKMGNSRPATKVSTEPCSAYGVVST